MNKRLLLTAGLLAAFIFTTPALQAAEKKSPSTPAPEKAKPAPTEKAPDPGKAPTAEKKSDPNRPTPYHGKVTAVDPAGKSVSIKGALKDRVFNVTDKTKVLGKDGQSAKLTSIPVGEEIRGTATKAGDTWTAQSVYIGPKEATPAKKEKGKKGEETAAPKAGAPASDAAKKAQ